MKLLTIIGLDMLKREDREMASSADLGPRLESFVESLVKTGRYRSRSEVMREGVRLVEEREKRLAALDGARAGLGGWQC